MSNPKASFYTYMVKKYKTNPNRYGDLTRDMIADMQFPKRIHYTKDQYVVIKRYLEGKSAHQNVIDTFVEAYYSEYLRVMLLR